MSDVALIARCAEHGLHGARTDCHSCAGPVEQVAMLATSRHEVGLMIDGVAAMVDTHQRDAAPLLRKLQEAYRTLGFLDEGRCPRCGSQAPHLHPAVQHGGEVSICPDPFHRMITSQNTVERVAKTQATLEQAVLPEGAVRQMDREAAAARAQRGWQGG